MTITALSNNFHRAKYVFAPVSTADCVFRDNIKHSLHNYNNCAIILGMSLKILLRKLYRSRYHYSPLITVEISKSRLIHNLEQFQDLTEHHSVAPVLKSNAYGHGLVEVAQIIEEYSKKSNYKIPFLVVDSYFEVMALRSQGIKLPLLTIGYIGEETIAHNRLKNVSFTITSLESLKRLSEAKFSGFGNTKKIHLKIDTGMRRQGILPGEVDEAISILKTQANLILEGVCSHLNDADNTDTSFTKKQIELWNKISRKLQSEFPTLKYLHLSNTDGHRYAKEINATVSRLGLGLYGLLDTKGFNEKLTQEPVMEIKTVLTGIKKIRRGESIGYSNSFIADKDLTVATVPVGYYEGVDRRLSNIGTMLVGKERIPCRIIGRVSMNITSLDISGIKDPHIGTEVIVVSRNNADANSMTKIAELCGTITYEGSVKIPTHLKRVIVP